MNGLPASSRHKPRETDEAVLLIYSAERSVGEITDFLGIKPTPRRGGRLRTDSMRRPLPPTGWFLSSKGEVDSGDVVDHLDWLIRRLANVETRLLELQGREGDEDGRGVVLRRRGGRRNPTAKTDGCAGEAQSGMRFRLSFRRRGVGDAPRPADRGLRADIATGHNGSNGATASAGATNVR